MFFNDITVYLTEECNFRCDYCYFKKGFKETLNIKRIKSWIDLCFSKLADRNKTVYITLLGGEPLLKKRLLFQTIHFINKKIREDKLDVKILLFTNGSLLKKRVMRGFIENNVQVCLSMDGIKESNDCYRRFKGASKKSTFESIVKNLRGLPKSYRERIRVNMVTGPKNCRYLMDNICFLQSLDFYAIDINIMDFVIWPRESLKILVEQLHSLYNYYQTLFSGVSKNKPFRMYQLEGLFHGGWGKTDSCHRIKLGPDGNLYSCDAFFSVASCKRKNYQIRGYNKKQLAEGIENIKREAREMLSKGFPKIFLPCAQNKMVYCPYGVYYYSKLHNKDLKKSLKNFYLFSRIYSSFLMHLFEKLKRNEKFIEFYGKNRFDKQMVLA